MMKSADSRKRRRLLGAIGLSAPAFWLSGCGGESAAATTPSSFQPLELTEAQWREILTDEEFRVLRKEGTEPAFSSPLDKQYGDGVYICAGCNLTLFSSEHKFDSGTGWPSFWRPIDADHVGTKRDFKLIWPRTEYHCARCGGHQGHIFDDGPEPTGQRWCNNGVALRFVPTGEDLPSLRRGASNAG